METSFLRETLKLGRYRLNDELEVLKNRATNRNRLKWLRSSCDQEPDSNSCNDACFLSLNTGFLGVWIQRRCISIQVMIAFSRSELQFPQPMNTNSTRAQG